MNVFNSYRDDSRSNLKYALYTECQISNPVQKVYVAISKIIKFINNSSRKHKGNHNCSRDFKSARDLP